MEEYTTNEDLFRTVKLDQMIAQHLEFKMTNNDGVKVTQKSPISPTLVSFTKDEVVLETSQDKTDSVIIGQFNFDKDGFVKRSDNDTGLSVRNLSSGHSINEKSSILSFVTDLPDEINKNVFYHILAADIKASSFSETFSKLKIHEHPKINFSTFFCYCLPKGTKLPDSLEVFIDNKPEGHRTILPQKGKTVCCWIGNQPGKKEIYCSSDFYICCPYKFHCLKIKACAEPEPLRTEFDPKSWTFASLIYSNYHTLDMEFIILADWVMDYLSNFKYPAFQECSDIFFEKSLLLFSQIRDNEGVLEIERELDYGFLFEKFSTLSIK